MTAFSSRVARAERDAIGDARGGDVEDALALGDLLASADDWHVREIAAYCLAAIPDPAAVAAIIPALADDHFQVRAAAAGAVRRRAGADLLPELLFALDRSDVAFIQKTIMLTIGGFDPALAIPALAERCPRARDPEAKEACVVALARAGDREARRTFAAALHTASDDDIGRWLEEHCPYVHDVWLLPALAPVLDRETPVVSLDYDRPNPPPPDFLRACDLAVFLVASISGHTFSFPIERVKQYAEHEIAEVRAYVSGLPRAT